MAAIPEKFYKYRPLDDRSLKWVERTVLQDEIHFAAAATFNDPFDLCATFDFQAEPARQREDFLRMSRKHAPHLSEKEHNDEADRVMSDALSPANIAMTTSVFQLLHNRLMRTDVGVYCVSTKPDEILMWSHYADNHQGVCLEFDGFGQLMAPAQQVEYAPDRPSINPYFDTPERMMECALLTKAKQWSYESEWRVINNGGPGTIRFNPTELTGIIIGASAPQTVVDTVLQWNRLRPLPVRITRAYTDSKAFKVNLVPYKEGRLSDADPTRNKGR